MFRKLPLFFILVLSVSFTGLSWATKQIHQHSSKEIEEGFNVPKIQMQVQRDAMNGVNVLLDIQDYQLNSPIDKVENKDFLHGHAHVFINGEKKQRLYGKALHIPESWLRKGVNQIAISLNSHAHENWMKDGQSVVSSVFIDLAAENLVLHHFSSQPTQFTHQHD